MKQKEKVSLISILITGMYAVLFLIGLVLSKGYGFDDSVISAMILNIIWIVGGCLIYQLTKLVSSIIIK